MSTQSEQRLAKDNKQVVDTRQAYNIWSKQYDTNINKTRDLEAYALRTILAGIHFDTCLEIGCGTGKNTEWLITKAKQVTSVDLSDEMLAKAKEKISPGAAQFIQADITSQWTFRDQLYEVVTFSLVLEHIQNLDHIFREVAESLVDGGQVYVGELHPFKQYTGSKARFETGEGTQIVPCFNHHISDFTQSAKCHGLSITDINEYFDDSDKTGIPRILTLIFKKI
ncbi:MAG: class SAM-dependent methyltransferase [Ferruginibacter sp.]|nr:class SAM-dependent methyltransferase [Ferruginibacter sp.]